MLTQVYLILLLIPYSLSVFPKDFVWGSATASYQVEGAYNVSRGLTIWDDFSHTPGKVANGATGDVAVDHYHRYVEDVALMKSLGLKNYRFSIAWSRLFPTGIAPANPDGFQFYNNLINELLKNDIEPFVTLFHWDIPSAIDNAWLNASVVDYFAAYANASFAAFGDRVKKWITFNEPLTFTHLGYGTGTHAPGRCSDRTQCSAGNSSTEPYIATHHVLLSHAAAVQIYRSQYQTTQGGVIGITLNCDYAEPYSTSADDQAASERHLEFQLSWYADPIFKGDYPQSMKDLVGDRLPQFTDAEKKQLNGSWDYFGLNHYTSGYSQNNPAAPVGQGWDTDQQVNVLTSRDGQMIGVQADSPWLLVVPWGIYKMLNWVSARYGNPPIYITENGVSVPNENSLPLTDALNDTFRVSYYDQYISNVSKAIDGGVNVKGYFAWSLMDNFEWADGYTKRFGLVHIDYDNNLTRIPKASAKWYSELVANGNIPPSTTTSIATSSASLPLFSLALTCCALFVSFWQ